MNWLKCTLLTRFISVGLIVEQDPEHYKVKSRNAYSATYTMPKRLLQFRTPSAPRELTDEQRAELRERMKKLQVARQNKASVDSQPSS